MKTHGRFILLVLGLAAVIAGTAGRWHDEARPAPTVDAGGVVSVVEVRAAAPGAAAAWRVSPNLN